MRRFFQTLLGLSDQPRRSPSPKRRTQLGVEQLDGRLLPSATGSISSITDAYGQTTCFTVGLDRGIYASLNNYGYTKLSGGAGSFYEVSAGMSADGHAVCWAEASNGDLWWFSGYTYDHSSPYSSQPVYGEDVGNPGNGIYQLSAGRHDDCFVVANNSVWVYSTAGPFWQGIVGMAPGYAPRQISAGVDSFGHDQVYVVTQPGYVLECYQNGSFNWAFNWLQNQRGQYIQATQLSASISSNNDYSNTDFFYVNKADGTLHDYYNGYDAYLGGAGQIQNICAATNANGDYCVVTVNDYWHYNEVYAVGFWTGWTDLQNQATEVAAAGDGMIFTVEPNLQIWGHDPNNDWAHAWGGIATPWHYTGGISG